MVRILFITATRVGDAVLSTGVLATLLQQYPKARLTIACGESAAGLFYNVPQLERLIIMTKRRYDLHWFDLWKQCVSYRWDITVDLRGSPITWLLLAHKRYIKHGGRRPGHRIHHLAQIFPFSPTPLPTVWLNEDEQKHAATLIPEKQKDKKLLLLDQLPIGKGKFGPLNVTPFCGSTSTQLTLTLSPRYFTVRASKKPF